MNPAPSSKKNIIIALVVIVLFMAAYFYISGGESADTGTLLNEQITPEVTVVNTRVLTLLTQIQSLRIDTSVFSDPAYRTLVDYTVQIPQQDVGRPNPFAPLPGRSSTLR